MALSPRSPDLGELLDGLTAFETLPSVEAVVAMADAGAGDMDIEPQGAEGAQVAQDQSMVLAAFQVQLDGMSQTMGSLEEKVDRLLAASAGGNAQGGQLGGVVHGMTQAPSGAAATAHDAMVVDGRERSPATEVAHATPVQHATHASAGEGRAAPAMRKGPRLDQAKAHDHRVIKVWWAEATKGMEKPSDLIEKLQWDEQPEQVLWIYEYVEGAGRDKPLSEMTKAFMQTWAGQVRPAKVIALERLISGDIRQGKGSVAQYAESFEAVVRLLPEESIVSLCKHFVNGLSDEMKVLCCLDREGREWTELRPLIEFALGEERRLHLARRLVENSQSSQRVADRVLTRDPARASFQKRPASAEASAVPNKRVNVQAILAAAPAEAGPSDAKKGPRPPTEAQVQKIEQILKACPPVHGVGRDQWVQAPLGKDTVSMTLDEYLAAMPKYALRPEKQCPLHNAENNKRDADDNLVRNEVLRYWWLCTYCRQERHPWSVCPRWHAEQAKQATGDNRGRRPHKA